MLLGDDADRFGIRAALYLHDEAEDIAPRPAPEALIDSFARMDIERRGLLRVKGAASDVVHSALLQCDIVGYYAIDIGLISYVFSKTSRETHCLPRSLLDCEGVSTSRELENF
jgi:hypothetical protein